MNGRAAAPPANVCSIGVSTSRKPRRSSAERTARTTATLAGNSARLGRTIDRHSAGAPASSLISLWATGRGRNALEMICQESASADSSPRRELITSPCTNTMSPRSTSAF